MQLYYDVHDGPGPYVLLVHGFLSSRAQWRPNLAALARVMRPVVVELWGHGRSPAPTEPAPYHPEAYRVQGMMWTWRRWCNVLLMVGMLLTPGPAVAGSMDWDALFTGDVAVEAVKHPAGFSGVRASFAVSASRERIWTVLLDYANFPKIFHDIHTMRVLAHDQQGAQVEYWIHAMLSTYHYVLYRRYDEPGRRLTWTRIAGDLKRMEGSWEIRDTPRPDVQMLVYESYVDIGGILPMAMVRAEAMRKTREMGERLRSWIEGHPRPE